MRNLSLAAVLTLSSLVGCHPATTSSCTSDDQCVKGMQCDLISGQCVGCVDDRGCSGTTPRCLISTHHCVPCLPGPDDNCPTGQYCKPDNTCAAGCRADSDCSTGSRCCGHTCIDVQNDARNCGGCGALCSGSQGCCSGACAALNTTDHCGACGVKCGAGQGCCGNSCTPLNTLSSCGMCGNVCPAGDFCDGTTCNHPTYPNFCNNPTVVVIYDGITPDNHAADVMASTITTYCPATVTVRTGSQTDPTLVDQTTGQPLAGGGVTYVLGGGPFPNMPLKWLERTHQTTKIYFDAPDGVNFYWKRRSDSSVAAQMPGSACNPKNDQFITELVTDPISGTLSLIGYGACSGGQGTLAAAWYYANAILPNRASYPDSWYLYSWSDTDNDGTPSAGDTYTVLAHGM